jgi:butyrate response factor 1
MKKDDIDLESNEIVTKSKKSSKNSKRSTDASNQESAEKKSLYKTELCRNWEETNHCRYGMKCQYAHGAADLREIDRHPKYKTQKCRTFHQTGSCPYGARCTFRHFNLPGDALEMKNLDKEEEKEKEKQHVKREDSIFSAENQKLMQQNWFLDNSNGLGDLHKHLMMNQPSSFDPEDSLLPSNAESLLPHQLLFDLESPDEDVDQPRRCPLRNYVNLPSFSNFQAPHYLPSNYHQAHQQQQDSNCKTFFRPWLF